jgi:hypothetical protein
VWIRYFAELKFCTLAKLINPLVVSIAKKGANIRTFFRLFLVLTAGIRCILLGYAVQHAAVWKIAGHVTVSIAPRPSWQPGRT